MMRRNGIYPPSVKPGIPCLGKCPDGWRTLRFGDALEVVERNAVVEDDQEYQLVIAKRNRGGIEPRERLKGRHILTKTQRYIESGDFLISRRQIIHGACGLVPVNLDGSLVSNEYSTLLARESLIKEYFEYFTHTTHFQQTCFHSSVGVDVEKMVFRLGDWLGHRFHLPPVSEQMRIVEVLSAWERTISSIDEIINAKQRLRTGLIQQLLTGRIRFSEFGGPARRRGEIPGGWKQVHLKDVARVNPSPSRPDNEQSRVSFLAMSDISEHGRIISLQEHPYLSVSKGFTSFRDDDILVAKITPCFENGKSAHIAGLRSGIGYGSTEFHVIRAQSADSRFLFLHTRSQSFRGRGEANMTGSAGQKRVPTDFIRNYPLLLPKHEEQKRIASTLYACDREIQLLAEKRDCLKEQKAGLMQRLLTGGLRVMKTQNRRGNNDRSS